MCLKFGKRDRQIDWQGDSLIYKSLSKCLHWTIVVRIFSVWFFEDMTISHTNVSNRNCEWIVLPLHHSGVSKSRGLGAAEIIFISFNLCDRLNRNGPKSKISEDVWIIWLQKTD